MVESRVVAQRRAAAQEERTHVTVRKWFADGGGFYVQLERILMRSSGLGCQIRDGRSDSEGRKLLSGLEATRMGCEVC